MAPDSLPEAVVEDLHALSGAAVELRSVGLGPTGAAGIALLDPGTVPVDHAVAGVEDLFSADARALDPATRVVEDRLGQPWVVLRTDPDRFADLPAALAVAADSLSDRGYGDHLLAVAVELESPHDGRLYLCYRFDRRAYYPFAPRPDGRRRHRGLERRVLSVVADGLPTLSERGEWTPLWGEGDGHPWGTAD